MPVNIFARQAQTSRFLVSRKYIYKKRGLKYNSLAHGLRSAITSPDERAIADPTHRYD